MNFQYLSIAFAVVTFGFSPLVIDAEVPNWTGEFADKKFMNGQGVFQLSITEEARTIKVSFDAVYNDGHACAPEAEGTAKIAGKGILQFNFQDNHRNAGSGTIARAGDDIIVSLKTSRVADPHCVVFYRENMRLKRIGKK
jgi:hypothetical protein